MKKHSSFQPSSVIEIPLSLVKPNPWRQLEQFPLDEARLAVLRKSIQRTDFWGNVVCRKRGDSYEIAYGHHRLEALRRELGMKAKVRLLCREIDDETMLKMMAADNDDAYNLSPGFILETVEAAKSFISRKSHATRSTGLGELHKRVALFLNWPPKRVQFALAQLGAIQAGDLSREAVKKLSKQREAIALHDEVQKAKKRGAPIPLAAQEKAAERVAKRESARSEVAVKDEIAVETHPQPTPQEQQILEFEKYLGKAIEKLSVAEAVLRELVQFKSDLTGEIYGRSIKTTRILFVCEAMEKLIAQIFDKGVNYGRESQETDQSRQGHLPPVC